MEVTYLPHAWGDPDVDAEDAVVIRVDEILHHAFDIVHHSLETDIAPNVIGPLKCDKDRVNRYRRHLHDENSPSTQRHSQRGK